MNETKDPNLSQELNRLRGTSPTQPTTRIIVTCARCRKPWPTTSTTAAGDFAHVCEDIEPDYAGFGRAVAEILRKGYGGPYFEWQAIDRAARRFSISLEGGKP